MANDYDERFQAIIEATGFKPRDPKRKNEPHFNSVYFQRKSDPSTTTNLPYVKKGNQIYIIQKGGTEAIPIEKTDVEIIPGWEDKYREYDPWDVRGYD